MYNNIYCASNVDGRLEIFCVKETGEVYHNWQVKPNSGWNGWASLGGDLNIKEKLVVAKNQDGRLELFGHNKKNEIVHIWQTQPANPSSPWSDWTSMGSI